VEKQMADDSVIYKRRESGLQRRAQPTPQPQQESKSVEREPYDPDKPSAVRKWVTERRRAAPQDQSAADGQWNEWLDASVGNWLINFWEEVLVPGMGCAISELRKETNEILPEEIGTFIGEVEKRRDANLKKEIADLRDELAVEIASLRGDIATVRNDFEMAHRPSKGEIIDLPALPARNRNVA
jgi:hypothetical protein